jgi:hypothetical protein
MHWCPCGQDVPCPEHGEFNEYFWETSPVSAEYMSSLRTRGLPYTNPFQLLREQEAKEKAEKAEKEKLEKQKLEKETLENQKLESETLQKSPQPQNPPAPPTG